MIGGYVGYNIATWESDLLDTVNAKRVERGMPAITRQSLEIGNFVPTKAE